MYTDTIQRSQKKVLGKWRNAISIVEDEETGEISLHRFDKREARWVKLAYFTTAEDFDDFVDFCDEHCPGGEEEEGED